MQNGLTTISKVIFHLSSNIGKLLQVALVGVCVVFLVGCKDLTGQNAQEKMDCFNKCSSVCTTHSCHSNCASTCGCTYTGGDTGGFARCE